MSRKNSGHGAEGQVTDRDRGTRRAVQPVLNGPMVMDPRFASTLINGLRILEAFADGSPWLGNKEFCAVTGEHKATVSRLTRTLMEMGYLQRASERGKFELGLAVLSLGYPRLINLPIRRIAHPLMQDLAEQVHGVVNLGLQDRFDLVYVESCRTLQTAAPRPEIGARRPLVSTSMGQMYLAALPEDARESLFAEIETRSLASMPALRAGVASQSAELRERGFSFASAKGYNSIAAPVHIARDGQIGVINCLVEDAVMSRAKMLQAVPKRLLAVAGRIEEALGIDIPGG
jgi:DNA-binding IclR family transcriptional regulator